MGTTAAGKLPRRRKVILMDATSYLGNVWATAEAVLPHAPRVLLFGPPGMGKTHVAERIGLGDRRLYVATMTAETPRETLEGHYVVVGSGRFLWADGPGVMAWKTGGRLVVNEIDKPRGDALDGLHVITDDYETACLTLPVLTPTAERRMIAAREDGAGETEWSALLNDLADDLITIRQHPRFQCVGTCNGGPNDLPEAVRDRMTVRLNITHPSPDAFLALPDDIRNLANGLVGKRYDRGVTGTGTWSLRPFFAFSSLRESCGSEVAAVAVFGNQGPSILDSLRIAASPGERATLTNPYTSEIPVTPRPTIRIPSHSCNRCGITLETDDDGYDWSQVDSDGDHRCPSCESYTRCADAEDSESGCWPDCRGNDEPEDDEECDDEECDCHRE